MSSPEYHLELSAEAYDDLLNIQNYTFTEFGESGWLKYGRELDVAMQQIQMHPNAGHSRDDIPSDYLAWVVNEHVMIYRIKEQTIYLVRVLHAKMNFRFQFK